MALGYSRNLQLTMEETETRIRERLEEQGFGVLTEIDVASTFKKKLGIDFRPYKILGSCHPQSAYKALSIDEEIGLMLPCNITLSQNDDGTVKLSAIDANEMFKIIDQPGIEELAGEVTIKLRAAVDAV